MSEFCVSLRLRNPSGFTSGDTTTSIGIFTTCLNLYNCYHSPFLLNPFMPPVEGEVFLEEAQMAGWLQPLPKLIWELSDLSPDTTSLALRMLLDAARFTPSRPPEIQTQAPRSAAAATSEIGGFSGQDRSSVALVSSPLRSTLDKLQRQLAPLFCIVPTQQQPQQQQQQQQLQNCHATLSPSIYPLCDLMLQRGKKAADVSELKERSQPQGVAGSGVTLLCSSSQTTPGPLSRLPLDVQLLAVDLMYHLSEWTWVCEWT